MKSASAASRKVTSRRPVIHTIESLRQHLQTAIEVEHFTIPPYLCALYSIPEGANEAAAKVMKSVVMEEMLHMVLVANVLNAVGGHPRVNVKGFVPRYPAHLPHSGNKFKVSLEKFSKRSVGTFLKIERPAKPHAPPEGTRYHTLGQFYEAVEDDLKWLCRTPAEEKKVFSGKRSLQITPEYYYGGGGEVMEIYNLETALKALSAIVDQGEGIDHTIFDGDDRIFGQDREYAHYFRFNEILEGCYYTARDTPRSGPRGGEFPVDWNAVYDMRPNPRAEEYRRGSEVRRKLDDFNRAYMELLDTLHRSVNGERELLLNGVGVMYDLKYLAEALMKIPSGKGKTVVGPSFECVP